MSQITPYQPAPNRSRASGGTNMTPINAVRLLAALLLYFVSLGWRKIRPFVYNSSVHALCLFGATLFLGAARLKQFADAVRQPQGQKLDTLFIHGPVRAGIDKLPHNEAAPVSAKQLTEEMALDYIARYHKTAIGEMQKFGIPASISLAQGLVESRAGDSKLARNNNNHFGMKCFSRSCRKGHCSNFTDDTHKDFFRKFKSPWESWRAHSQLLASGRYAKLKKHGRDYRQWAYGLKSLGYATDRTYAEKLIGIIERYELNRFDL